MKVRPVLVVTSATAFLKVHDSPSLILAIQQLRSIDPSQIIAVAVNSEMSQSVLDLLMDADLNFEFLICEPRNASSLALALLSESANYDAVMIHDASRPFVDHEQFERVLSAFSDDVDAVRPAMAFTETLKILTPDSVIRKTLDRSTVLRISTPELIRTSAIDINGSDSGWFLPLKEHARVIHTDANPNCLRINSQDDFDLMQLQQD